MEIGEFLLSRGVITREQFDAATAERAAGGDRLDRVLVRIGACSRETIIAALAEQFHLPVIDIASVNADPAVLSLLPAKLVFRQSVVPIARLDGTVTIATADPFDLSVIDELRILTGCSVELALADEDDLHKFIRTHYGVGGDTLDAMTAGIADTQVRTGESSDELEQAQEASVVKLVNDILTEAVSQRATDVHFEPYERELVVRYRIDGVLERANVPATINHFRSAIVSRLKIMANLNIAEKRLPQDGRIAFRSRSPGRMGEDFDLRVSVIPMLQGEGVVIRVLSKAAVLLNLDQLGMPERIVTRWSRLISRPHGILLVTGPTGSGKSTTLYASLNTIVSDEIKAITVEDPVEYHVAGVNQIQVNSRVGLDFAAGLRAILRHDPDVIMIGEIRDRETAETAIQASLTGHLVFSTLHTNDACGAPTRLLDMGVEPYLVSSTLEAAIAQRLVRKICADCGVADPDRLNDLPPGFVAPSNANFRRGTGCKSCRNTGYRGRIGVYELLELNDTLREVITRRASAPVLAEAARHADLLFALRDDGFAKAAAGFTSFEEVLQALAA